MPEPYVAEDYERLNQFLGLVAGEALDWLYVYRVTIGLVSREDMTVAGRVVLHLGEGKDYAREFSIREITHTESLEGLVENLKLEYTRALKRGVRK